MKLLEFKQSPNCLRVRMAFRLFHHPYTSIAIDPLDRREVEKISGQPKVPVLVDGAKILHDSVTILRYLDRKYFENQLFPSEKREGAVNEVLVDWCNGVFRMSVWQMFQEAFKNEKERNLEVIQEAGRKFRFHCRLLNQWLSDGRPYLTGEKIVAADLCFYPFVTYGLLPEKLKDHPLYKHHYRECYLDKELTFLIEWIKRLVPLSDLEIRSI